MYLISFTSVSIIYGPFDIGDVKYRQINFFYKSKQNYKITSFQIQKTSDETQISINAKIDFGVHVHEGLYFDDDCKIDSDEAYESQSAIDILEAAEMCYDIIGPGEIMSAITMNNTTELVEGEVVRMPSEDILYLSAIYTNAPTDIVIKIENNTIFDNYGNTNSEDITQTIYYR